MRYTLLVLVLLVLALGGSVSHASTGGAKGISTGGSLNWYGRADVAADLQMVADLGATVVRMDMLWDRVETSDNVYDWSQHDIMFDEATSRGLDVLWIVHRTPAWARSGGDNRTYPTDPVKYADFVYATVLRYHNRSTNGDLIGVEFWNEPNGSWAASDVTSTGAAKLAAMIREASPKLDLADPSLRGVVGGILRGGSSGSTSFRRDTDYLSDLYANGIAGHVDAVGFHPYSYPHDPTSTHADNGWTRIDDMAAIADVPLWLTEWGQHTGTSGGSVSESVHATYVTSAFSRYREEFAAGRVSGPFFVYQHRDGGTDPADREQNFGLARRDRTPKPAWNAYVSATAPTEAYSPACAPTCDEQIAALEAEVARLNSIIDKAQAALAER